MSVEKVQALSQEILNYLESRNAVQPSVYLFGRKKTDTSKESQVKHLSITDDNDLVRLKKILKRIAMDINRSIEDEISIGTIEETYKREFLFARMRLADYDIVQTFYNAESNLPVNEFMMRSKLINTFFVIEIKLNESGSKKIIILKKIVGKYKVNNSKWAMLATIFDNKTLKVNIIDDNHDMIFDENFDIIAYVDTSSSNPPFNSDESFFFIMNRDNFENLFNYHDLYLSTYNEVVEKLSCVAWNPDIKSNAFYRDCYRLSQYPQADEAIEQFIKHLSSPRSNITKKALEKNAIQFEGTDGDLRVSPTTVKQHRELLKILRNGLAKTVLVKNDVIIGDREIIT